MHIADIEKGMLGANGIVGGGIPLACGAALTAKTLGTGGVAVCFFGDGAANQGTFHGLNLAAIWNLPVVFVCENNGYAESTPVRYAARQADIANRAAPTRSPALWWTDSTSSPSMRRPARQSRGPAVATVQAC